MDEKSWRELEIFQYLLHRSCFNKTQKVFPRFFFVTFYVDQSNKRKSVHNAGKSVFWLAKLSSLKVISVLKTNEEIANQRHKILQTFALSQTPQHHHTNVHDFSQLCGAISLLSCKVILFLKLGKFTNFKTLFSAVLTEFVKPIFIKILNSLAEGSKKGVKTRYHTVRGGGVGRGRKFNF